jgi:hypothetical protein
MQYETSLRVPLSAWPLITLHMWADRSAEGHCKLKAHSVKRSLQVKIRKLISLHCVETLTLILRNLIKTKRGNFVEGDG